MRADPVSVHPAWLSEPTGRPVLDELGVGGLHGKHLAQVSLAEDQRSVSTRGSASQFAAEHRGGTLSTSMPASARTEANDAVRWPVRSCTRNWNRAA